MKKIEIKEYDGYDLLNALENAVDEDEELDKDKKTKKKKKPVNGKKTKSKKTT